MAKKHSWQRLVGNRRSEDSLAGCKLSELFTHSYGPKVSHLAGLEMYRTLLSGRMVLGFKLLLLALLSAKL